MQETSHRFFLKIEMILQLFFFFFNERQCVFSNLEKQVETSFSKTHATATSFRTHPPSDVTFLPQRLVSASLLVCLLVSLSFAPHFFFFFSFSFMSTNVSIYYWTRVILSPLRHPHSLSSLFVSLPLSSFVSLLLLHFSSSVPRLVFIFFMPLRVGGSFYTLGWENFLFLFIFIFLFSSCLYYHDFLYVFWRV